MSNYTLTQSNVDVVAWGDELLGYLEEMQQFADDDPAEVLMKLSAFSSRASYMRIAVARAESRPLIAFRTKQIEPFIEEAKYQFNVWSRLISVQRNEWEMSKGF